MNAQSPFFENVVVITGASSGIGRALALELAKQGAWLTLAARREDRLQEVANQCEELGAVTLVVPTDVSDEAQCKNLINQTVATYGRLDTLINNAGITMGVHFDQLTNLDMVERIMRVNYLGSVYCTYYALPHLKESKGRIVGVSSLTGKTGVPTRTAYAASKHAMAGFFDSLRIEVAEYNVSVTMIYPGFVQSEIREHALDGSGNATGRTLTDEKGIMTAEECAQIIVEAAAKRKREVVMTLTGKLALWIKLIAPGLLDRVARRKIEDS